ncbi:MAG: metallopeptidase family protein [Thermoleophilia bacterium]|nr:metallopeptidase family protein [Thermoleophilia bacterium]
MTRVEFEELVARAIDLVPEDFAGALEEIAITVEDRAPAHMGRLYGLYQGVPRSRPEGHGWMELPPRISIYMEPLVRDFPHPDDLVEQVRITVLHEIGHHLGMDEDQLRELGYG